MKSNTQQRQSKVKRQGRAIVKLLSLGTLACLILLFIIDHNQLEFTQADARSHLSLLQLQPRPQTITFSPSNDFQNGAMALLEVPLFVAALTLSLPILPLIQYCVGILALSYYTKTAMREAQGRNRKFYFAIARVMSKWTATVPLNKQIIDLYIKDAKGRLVAVYSTPPETTGRDLLTITAAATNVPKEHQMIYIGARMVDPNSSLALGSYVEDNTRAAVINVLVKGRGGGGGDSQQDVSTGDIIDECVSCGEMAKVYCKNCEVSRCTLCCDQWHKHPKRRNHELQVITETAIGEEFPGTSSEATAVCTPDKTLNSSFSDDYSADDLQFFDSIALDIDIGEATKRSVLAEKFHLTHFKDFQKEAIDATLQKKNSLIIQPTGSGKSLCFQFPAVYMNKTSLVVTPTISLMQDQTHELTMKGITSTFFGSAQADPNAENKVFEGGEKVSVLFVTPEWLFSEDSNNLEKMQQMHRDDRLALIAIDEAHLVHEWQDFRQCYKKCETLPSLFPGTPIMALSATVTPEVQQRLVSSLGNPVILKSSVNRSNIKRSESSKQSIALDARDFNTFADRVAEVVGRECSIVYTDFACHVRPIVLALRDRGLSAIGYYGKMRENEKRDAYTRWKTGEISIIVATRAFGLGINKPDVRYVIRNGLPPSLAAWAQEFGRAGRDGKPAAAYILYSDNDINHVGFWARNMTKESRQEDICDIAARFSNALPYSYAHLAGKCRRAILLEAFGEALDSVAPCEACCDVCASEVSELHDRKSELTLLTKAIEELHNFGEVKVTEWIRGGKVAWMSTTPSDSQDSAYGKGSPNLSKQWWRSFIRQAAAAGYIHRRIRPAKFGNMQGTYANLQITDKGRDAVSNSHPVLLPALSSYLGCSSSTVKHSNSSPQGCKEPHAKVGKGKNMLPILEQLISETENYLDLTPSSKEQYHYPGSHDLPQVNVLYHIEDMTELPHHEDSDPHFIWRDVQLSKTSTSRNTAIFTILGKSEKLHYWMARCKGVRKCSECDNVAPNATLRYTCPQHPAAPIEQVRDCPVEFVYIFPADLEDRRRWIGGIVRSSSVPQKRNHHNHPIANSLSHKIPKIISSDISRTLQDNPYLTTQQLATGHGLGYRPGSADLSASSHSRLQYCRKKSLKDSGLASKGAGNIMDMEKIADRIDGRDQSKEGGSQTHTRYAQLGRPYMKDYSISPTLTYQFIMTPLMCQLLSEADFMEADTTYNENGELQFLFNATVFEYTTMRWAVVARMRANKEDTNFYKTAFQLTFDFCKRSYPSFEVGGSLRGILVDWSDTEAKGLREAVGENVADQVLRGCKVHWGRSYKRLAKRVNKAVSAESYAIAVEAFCHIAKAIPTASSKENVYKLFDALQGTLPIREISGLVPEINDKHIKVVMSEDCWWTTGKAWVQWWLRPRHLQMLTKSFSLMDSETWKKGPKDTNGVERINLTSKGTNSRLPPLYAAMQSLYETDKAFCLMYIAAEQGNKVSYRERSCEKLRADAAAKRLSRKNWKDDKTAKFGPPDKHGNLNAQDDEDFLAPMAKKSKTTPAATKCTSGSSAEAPSSKRKCASVGSKGKGRQQPIDEAALQRKEVEVYYDDGNWYRGWLSSFNFNTGKWIVHFYEDGDTTEVSFPDKEVRLIAE